MVQGLQIVLECGAIAALRQSGEECVLQPVQVLIRDPGDGLAAGADGPVTAFHGNEKQNAAVVTADAISRMVIVVICIGLRIFPT